MSLNPSQLVALAVAADSISGPDVPVKALKQAQAAVEVVQQQAALLSPEPQMLDVYA